MGIKTPEEGSAPVIDIAGVNQPYMYESVIQYGTFYDVLWTAHKEGLLAAIQWGNIPAPPRRYKILSMQDGGSFVGQEVAVSAEGKRFFKEETMYNARHVFAVALVNVAGSVGARGEVDLDQYKAKKAS